MNVSGGMSPEDGLNCVAVWTMSIATLVSRQAGLSLEDLVPTNYALEYAPIHSHQGAPLVSVGKPVTHQRSTSTLDRRLFYTMAASLRLQRRPTSLDF